MAARTDIVRLKITLVMPPMHVRHGARPIVMRRLCVALGIRLDRLHLCVQAAFGWTGTHLWEFSAGGTGWGPNEPYADTRDGPLDAAKATLLDVLGVRTLRYLYDFGDGWEHTIRIERIFKGVPGLDLPFLLDATGRCPPEDIGGPAGNGELIEAIADPGHARHREFAEIYHAGLDNNAVDIRQIEEALAALAARSPSGASARVRKPRQRAAGGMGR